ncbi:GPW/gp25 family protein [Cellulomonas dongxiuzhuiae]|uniref:GPW/gp25 family protein n=2 Tax=Cellulomonas dongxiuzhuiae TaxID=2819979 RepID=A0ABX8GP38_9CELL|nr:GPW/gp25 family protein [Cellulomonas dongxiuzhuiae]MBO3094618.1 GPW/gp25 family protein [Cellulomonas dongxiuzhuiae]QWC17978.1 GPW/gp25 family protein [Cellulomonas dongxiuzhuiae]
MTVAADFVGRGFAWPFTVDHTGSIAMTDGTGDVEDAMRVVLLTAPGERLMRPAFGCRIWDLLFEPITPNLVGLVRQAVRDALAQWEPRVDVEDVRPVQDPGESGLLHIQIDYQVRSTNDRRNLVFPFYVIPREDS